MNTTELKEKLLALENEQKEREQTVHQWQSQIDQLTAAIKQTKEIHDFTRGRITELRDIIKSLQTNESN